MTTDQLRERGNAARLQTNNHTTSPRVATPTNTGAWTQEPRHYHCPTHGTSQKVKKS